MKLNGSESNNRERNIQIFLAKDEEELPEKSARRQFT